MALLQPPQHHVIERLHRTGDEEAAGLAQPRQQVGVRNQVLHLDRDVVGQTGEPPRDPLDHPHGMPHPVEEIRVAESDVPGPLLHLCRNVGEYGVGSHDTEAAAVDRDDRAVPADVLAAAARLRITGHLPCRAVLQRGVAAQRRQPRAPRRNQVQPRKTGQRNEVGRAGRHAGRETDQIRLELPAEKVLDADRAEQLRVQRRIQAVGAQARRRIETRDPS